MPGNWELTVSDQPQIGDALLTIVREEARKPTPEQDARRRLEFFVLRAEALVARLAERQDAGEQDTAILRDLAVGLREDLARLTVVVGELAHGTAQEALQRRQDRETDRAATDEAVRLVYGELSRTYSVVANAAVVDRARIAALEARTWRGRWNRVRAWLGG